VVYDRSYLVGCNLINVTDLIYQLFLTVPQYCLFRIFVLSHYIKQWTNTDRFVHKGHRQAPVFTYKLESPAKSIPKRRPQIVSNAMIGILYA
jgi:hypothetical protein